MLNRRTQIKKWCCTLGCALLTLTTAFGQVKIGDNPGTIDPSALLEMESTTQGVLVPRMTTAQRVSIASPANGLLVYDTDLKDFFFFQTNSWARLNSESKRSNYKLVQSASDLEDELTAGGGTTYLLDSSVYYEINGTINLVAPIDLNDAYVSGLDANEDKLIRTGGVLFTGDGGGSIRNLTLIVAGGTIFSLSGTGAETLVFQNCIAAGNGVTTDVMGSISNYNIVFMNIINIGQLDDGFVFTDINNVLLSNLAWFESNTGTFETYIGNFDLIEKISGFCKVSSGATAIDLSANPTVSNGTLLSVPFSGAGTYVNGYTTGTYGGYYFSREWDVDCPGIKLEADRVAVADFHYTGSLTSGFTQSITSSTAVELQGGGSFLSSNLFRFVSSDGGNRLTYDGYEVRNFQINASLSIRVTNALGDFYAFLIYKNGIPVTESNAIAFIDASYGNSQIQNIALNTIIEMQNGDYVEVYVHRLTGSGTDTITVYSENLSIK